MQRVLSAPLKIKLALYCTDQTNKRMPDFCHLHCHSHYSLLDGAADISALMAKAKKDGQKGIALTDHGNMFGAFKFVSEAASHDLKAMVGCEFYLVEDRHKQSFLKSQGEKDIRFHQLLLAKNQKGYENLSKLCSLGFIEGLYGKYPRIDKELLDKYKEGLIATSCCLAAEIPRTLASGNMALAEEKLRWWLDRFGEDYYIEIQRHRGLEQLDGMSNVSQESINQQLLGLAKKYNIKSIATNDVHYVDEEDSRSHEIILCVNTGKKMEDIDRFKFSSSDYYFKSQNEMSELFKDLPHAIEHTMEVFEKIESPVLARDIILPNFPLPKSFNKQTDYLRSLVFEGAIKCYGEITEVIRERLEYELNIINDMGFAGYFLIVQDFIAAARKLGVAVGPGRGSAAGSAVAYCLKITNIDPIKYNLLFERFLNPARVSMPDIDIDFDDEGRQKVINYVVDKYGKDRVAQIVTFGTMAARSSIRDVGRVMSVPLSETDRIAKLVPSRPGTKLKSILNGTDSELKSDWSGDDYSRIVELRTIKAQTNKTLLGDVIALAEKVEGTVRNTGIHAAGLIIAPDEITKYIPVCSSKETDLLITQFEGSLVENAGMLKMDFLGLKTLSIIKDTLVNIVKRQGPEAVIDPDDIPLDDVKSLELFQRGDMIGIFQFESDGMRKFLRELKPTSIEDLIAMNALYRPGPMDNIPSFIKRKHGQEDISYPHEWLKDILEPTYGIMVYQEQIMQTAQIMADYTLGNADVLRRAMGKKKASEMQKHREIFVSGAVNKGVNKDKAEEIYDTMEKFAQYGFNRSHAAAYSVVAFQTAYLKAHFPAEFMASVLTHNKSDIGKLNFFLREAKRMGIKVLGPDVNESELNFTVVQKGFIRFGLSAIKGVGEGPVEEIIRERTENEPFTSIYDMTKRLSLNSVNKKCFESLANSGALDSFNQGHRAQYFTGIDNFDTVIEHAIKYGNAYQNQKNQLQASLFGDMTDSILPEPELPASEPWNKLQLLETEKEVTGIYISGHPLDDYAMEVEHYTTHSLDAANESLEVNVRVAGIVTEVNHGLTKKSLGYAKFTLQDYRGSMQFSLYNEGYKSYKDLINLGEVLFVEGIHAKGYNTDNYYFRIKDIKLLDTVGKNWTKSLTLQLAIKDITDGLIKDLSELCKSNEGHHDFKVLITDDSDNIQLPFIGKKMKVNVDTAFIDKISILGIPYKLN